MAMTPVRCWLRLDQLVLGGFFAPAFGIAQLLLMLAILLDPAKGQPIWQAILGGLLSLGASVFLIRLACSLYQWIELDGPVLRGRKFWSRKLLEFHVKDIIKLDRGSRFFNRPFTLRFSS